MLPPLPGNGMWVRPQRQSSCPSLRSVPRPWSVEFQAGAAGGRAQAGPGEFALLSSCLLCGPGLFHGLVCLRAAPPGWAPGVCHVPGEEPSQRGQRLAEAAAGPCFRLGSRLYTRRWLPYFSAWSLFPWFSHPPCLPASAPDNFCVPQELPDLWG